MTDQEIEQKVKELLAKKFDIDFGLKIADSDIDKIRTVRDIVVYLGAWSKQENGTSSPG
jgi:acyl carrier protein